MSDLFEHVRGLNNATLEGKSVVLLQERVTNDKSEGKTFPNSRYYSEPCLRELVVSYTRLLALSYMVRPKHNQEPNADNDLLGLLLYHRTNLVTNTWKQYGDPER